MKIPYHYYSYLVILFSIAILSSCSVTPEPVGPVKTITDNLEAYKAYTAPIAAVNTSGGIDLYNISPADLLLYCETISPEAGIVFNDFWFDYLDGNYYLAAYGENTSIGQTMTMLVLLRKDRDGLIYPVKPVLNCSGTCGCKLSGTTSCYCTSGSSGSCTFEIIDDGT